MKRRRRTLIIMVCLLNTPINDCQHITNDDLPIIGWLHSHFVTGVLAFGVDGCIIWGKHNSPGSWNDSEMSRDLQDNLLDDELTAGGLGLLADSAFPTLHGAILTPLKQNDWSIIEPHRMAEFLDQEGALLEYCLQHRLAYQKCTDNHQPKLDHVLAKHEAIHTTLDRASSLTFF